MKKTILLTAMFLSLSFTWAQSLKSEKNDIKSIIQSSYVEGLLNEGNLKKIDLGIHPDFRFIENDSHFGLRIYTLPEWKKNDIVRKKTGLLPRVGGELISVKFRKISITNDAAIAKVKFYKGNKLITINYISLYKMSEGWKIINLIHSKI